MCRASTSTAWCVYLLTESGTKGCAQVGWWHVGTTTIAGVEYDKEEMRMEEKPRLARQAMCDRLAMEFQDEWIVNLGVGMPTLCSNYVDPEEKPDLSLGERRDRLWSHGEAG